MSGKLRVHLAAAGLFFLMASTIALLWSYPRLLVYILLIVAAVIAYGVLYLILAAWIDPKTASPATSAQANAVTGAGSDNAEGQPTATATTQTGLEVPAAEQEPDSPDVQHDSPDVQHDSPDVQHDSPDVQHDSPEERRPAKARTARKKKTRATGSTE
jgi:hypothetical protein